ncbi:polycomb protein Asx isoform X2 [Culicoides brevitarsis]|uniref:polycomb protein Asx isoform X2 n=1 Tax=Culicoides brevitarsis TaxID=469753 RepID=UPI00307C0915
MECDVENLEVSPSDYLQQQQQQQKQSPTPPPLLQHASDDKDPLEFSQQSTSPTADAALDRQIFQQESGSSISYVTTMPGIITTTSTTTTTTTKVPPAAVVVPAETTIIVEKPAISVAITPPRHTHHLRKPVPKPIATPTTTTSQSLKSNHHHHHRKTSNSSSSSSSSNIAAEQTQASTMREVLASIPGFSIKPSRRSKKKMSTAAQLAQTHEGCIDLETPDSILVGTNLRALLNINTFSILPPLYQHKLIQLLPSVDRPTEPKIPAENATEAAAVPQSVELKPSSLNNEFFARACLEWKERLSEGEFTPENQIKLKSEAEKEKSKLDPWKLKHFEPIWGEKGATTVSTTSILKSQMKEEKPDVDRPALKTTIKLRPTTSIASSSTATPCSIASIVKTTTSSPLKVTSPTKRTRTIGAMTRATSAVLQQVPATTTATATTTTTNKSPAAVPDLLPIRTTKPVSSRGLLSMADSSLRLTDDADNTRLSYPVNHLKRTLSAENDDENISAKVYKAEKRSEQTLTITSYDCGDNNERKHEITLIESTSMDSEQYSETSNQQNSGGFCYDESSGTPSENNKSGPVSNFSENSQLENLNEADLFYKSDKSTDQSPTTLETTTEDNGTTELHDDIQYIYQNEVSCGANEDIAEEETVVEEQNSNSGSNSSNSTETTGLNADYQTNFHQISQKAESHAVVDDNQIEIVSCDNLGEIMQASSSTTANVEDATQLMAGNNAHERDTTTMEELGISVHNEEEIVADCTDAIGDELMPCLPNMQNIQLDDPDQMDEHLTDAVNYVLESGEMAEETIESNLSVPVEEEIKPQQQQQQVYEMPKNYNAIATNSQGITLISPHPSVQAARIQEQQQQQLQVQHQIQQQQQKQALNVKHHIDGTTTFIMPSADYVTFDSSKAGTMNQSGGRFQNVRIIQQSPQPSPSPTLTPTPEQIMQAEILFEAPSTAEVKSEPEQQPTEMEVSSSMISTNSAPLQNLADQSSLVNIIPTSMGAGNMGIVSSGGNIIVATSNSIRTPINPAQFSTICIPSSAGVPIHTAPTINNTTKAIQLNQHFLIQKQQQQQNPQVHHIATATQPVTSAIQHVQANNKPLPKQIIYAHHPGTTTIVTAKDSSGQTIQVQQPNAFPNQKAIVTSVRIQQAAQQQQAVTQQQQQQQQTTVPVTRTTAFAQRVTHQAARLPMVQQQVTVRPQKKDTNNSITSVTSNKGRGGRSNTGGRPPPGAVNLERSYQICQAVILNSPNRHQLKAQLRPPQEFLAASAAAAKNKNSSASDSTTTTATTTSNKNIIVTKAINAEKEQTQYGNVTSSNKTTVRAPFQQKKTYIQRQQSPNLIVRQVYSTQAPPPGTSISNPSPDLGTASLVNNGNGQYVLVQRTGIIQESGQQRASSAPPSSRLVGPVVQNQIHGINGIPLNIAGRGQRPASVDIDTNISDQSPNPGIQAVTRRGPNQVTPVQIQIYKILQ